MSNYEPLKQEDLDQLDFVAAWSAMHLDAMIEVFQLRGARGRDFVRVFFHIVRPDIKEWILANMDEVDPKRQVDAVPTRVANLLRAMKKEGLLGNHQG